MTPHARTNAHMRVKAPADPKVTHGQRPLRCPALIAALLLLAAAACDTHEHRWVSSSRDGVVEISQAFAGESVTGETAPVYFALRNRGPTEDTLEAIVVEGAGSARIHEAEERDGIRVMSPVSALPLPADDVTELVPGGTHVMLLDLAHRPVAGDSLRGVLRFRSGREISLRAEVYGLTDLEDVVNDAARRSAG